MPRPKPTKQLLIDLVNGYQRNIEKLHHGLYECPLTYFYGNLNFHEALAFAAGSFKLREEKKLKEDFIKNADIYEIFKLANKKGYPLTNHSNSIAQKSSLKKRFEGLNPFEGNTFRDRLYNVPKEDSDLLKERLEKRVNKYVFDCQFDSERIKMNKLFNNEGFNELVNLWFQQKYPKRGKIVPAYASQIAKMISGYPDEHKGQLSLF